MLIVVEDYCNTHDCNICKIKHICDSFSGCFDEQPRKIEEAYNTLITSTKVNNSSTVDHPVHYNREGAMECIDEMICVFGVEAVKNFCLLNAWKYRYRASDKNGLQDLQKSDWYLRKYKELCNGTENI